jgi:phosphoglycerate kinase
MELKILEQAEIKGKKILLRVAYDITLQKSSDGSFFVPDDARIRATLPTIKYLLEKDCALGIMSWLGRPGGKVVPELSLKPVAIKLEELLENPAKFLNDCRGVEVEQEIQNLAPGEIVMLENTRFHPEEELGDPEFAKALVKGFDLIVYEAFAQAHRVHASTTGILQNLPAVAGFMFAKEIDTLSKLLADPKQPFVVVMGGAKVSDRIEVMQNLLPLADCLLVGGALANTFFASQGKKVGASLVEDVFVNQARGQKKDYQALAKTLLANSKILLPIDLVAARNPDSLDQKIIDLEKGEVISEQWAFYDIGPKTIEAYQSVLHGARTVFWSGPMGLFEKESFALGTKKIAEAIIGSRAISIIAGGDTEMIVSRYGFEGKFTHVSTGGGAALEFLAGKELPVMKYLVLPNN